MIDLHTETDLGEGCVPVGGQLGLLRVESSFSSFKIESVLVTPKTGIVVKGRLSRMKKYDTLLIRTTR